MPATHHPVATQLAERLRLTDEDDSPLGTEDAAAFAEEVLISCRLRISEARRVVLNPMKFRKIYAIMAEHEHRMDIVIASFASRFLPMLVERYNSVPHVISPYATMMRTLLDSGYFAKFMRGPWGSNLYRLQAERLAELDVRGDTVNVPDGMENAIVILVYLMVYTLLDSKHYHRNVMPPASETKTKLIPVLRSIQSIYARKLENINIPPGKIPSFEVRNMQAVFRNARDAELFLLDQLTIDKMLGAVGKMMPWVTCAGYDTGCWVKGKQKGRLSCARCETQTYCSKEHQKVDWPGQIKQPVSLQPLDCCPRDPPKDASIDVSASTSAPAPALYAVGFLIAMPEPPLHPPMLSSSPDTPCSPNDDNDHQFPRWL
ncbi:hypothetical protein K438DRAFT_1956355 [Mycena galopus ATCC 62051]|nr:hypothetical protein K438DRAFT_1956355 [Mycena galopus ATCC 62051]